MITSLTDQLTGLRDSIRRNRSELDSETLSRYLELYIVDPKLSRMLRTYDTVVVRAILYCASNVSTDRDELIDMLNDYFRDNKVPAGDALYLISIVLFLGGIDFQMNEIDRPSHFANSDPQSYDTSSSRRSSGRDEAKLLYDRKSRKWIVALVIVVLVALLPVFTLVRWDADPKPSIAFDQDAFDGRLVGTVMATNGKTIYLVEQFVDNVYSISTLVGEGGGKCKKEKVFKVKDDYLSDIKSVKFDKWIISNPQEGFYAFDKETNTLYVPLINENQTASDRYILFQFDGQYFVSRGNDAGYWLHPSLHSFKSLFAVGRTSKHLVRIDRMDNGSFRYAVWNREASMSNQPSITLFNDGSSIDDKLVFYQGNYKYIFDFGTYNLWVYNGDKILSCRNMEIICM